MRVHRSRLTSGYLQVPNSTARDGRLSHMARGILVEILSRPDGWDTTADDMWRDSVARHGKASPGRRQFRSAFAELKAHGYMSAEPAQLARGQVGTVLTARDIPLPVADVPACGTSAPPGKTGVSAGRTDVPASGTSAPPGKTSDAAGRTDVPHAGTSYRKRVSENGSGKTGGPADAVGQGAGGEGGEGRPGGCAAPATTSPSTTRAASPRPRTTKTRPRKTSPGFDMVRAAIPRAVAQPGTRLYPGLHRAIEDLLTGNPTAGIPRRTPEQVVARLNRRWHGERAEERSAPGYRGCDRCTASGCSAPRRSEASPEGCDRIKSRSAWLAAALLAQDCPDPGCEDGQIIGGGACRACQERHEDRRAVAAAATAAAARWQDERAQLEAANAVVDAWAQRERAEERRFRETLAAAGSYGARLEHQVQQHMTGWRDRNPRPTIPPRPQALGPVQGAFLIAVPDRPRGSTGAPQERARRRPRRTVVCTACDQGHRTDTDDTLCPRCRTEVPA